MTRQPATRVKICGIRTPEDARAAAQAGANFIGLVFVPGQRRLLPAVEALTIVSELKASGDGPPQVVGLFADQPLDEVNDIIQTCGLDLAQLCGSESPEYCRQVQAGAIKVLHVPASVHPEGEAIAGLGRRLRAYRDAGCLVTLDRQVGTAPGGTGQSFDWSIAAQLSHDGHSFLLAGGLTPENVAEAVALVRPWGVDVSSGVETDGMKDQDKIRAFIRNARQLSAVSGQPSD